MREAEREKHRERERLRERERERERRQDKTRQDDFIVRPPAHYNMSEHSGNSRERERERDLERNWDSRLLPFTSADQEGPRFDNASALLSLQKGCGLWTLSCDFVCVLSCRAEYWL